MDEAMELRRIWSGFMGARVLLTANNLGVFDLLTSPQSVDDIAEKLNGDRRGVEILLDALTGLKLVRKSGRRYVNRPLATRHLVRGARLYMGDILRHADTLWHDWSRLDEIIAGHRPAPAESRHDHEAFIRGMDNLAAFKAKGVVGGIGMKGVRRALDVAGGPGTYCRAMVAAGVAEATVFDLPATVEIARRINREANADRVTFIEGDCLVDDLGSGYDLVFISHLFHAYGPEENLAIMRKAAAALNPGGRVAVQEFPIDGSRTAPLSSALFAVNMLVNTERGRCYSTAEIGGWMRAAGLAGIGEFTREDTVIVVGRKPA
jgi:hypothetical protein